LTTVQFWSAVNSIELLRLGHIQLWEWASD